MNDKKMVLKHSSKKIVNRVFALVFAVAVFGTIFFAIMTFITNVNLNKTDFSSYLSFSDEIDINKVYGSSTQYKVSHTINVTNYTREKLTIDLFLTYKNEDNTIFVKTKTVVLNPSVKQNVYMYYYHETNSVELKSINFRLDNKTHFTVLYDDETYLRLYDGKKIITFGDVRQNILLMSMCILLLILSIMLYAITQAMYKNNSKKLRKKKLKEGKAYESNRSE